MVAATIPKSLINHGNREMLTMENKKLNSFRRCVMKIISREVIQIGGKQ